MLPSSAQRSLLFVTGNAAKFAEVRAYLPAHWHVQRVALDVDEVQAATAQEVSRAKAVAAYRALHSGSATAATAATAVLVDDTSLELDALHGLPGPYIKWFLHSLGPAGLARMTDGFAATAAAATAAAVVHDTGADGDTMPHRRATARCIFSYCQRVDAATATTAHNGDGDDVKAADDSELRVVQFEGVCRGVVVDVPRGSNGMGWDSVFVPDEQPPPPPPSSSSCAHDAGPSMTTEEEGRSDGRCRVARTFAEMTMAEKATMSHRARALDALRAYFDDA